MNQVISDQFPWVPTPGTAPGSFGPHRPGEDPRVRRENPTDIQAISGTSTSASIIFAPGKIYCIKGENGGGLTERGY